MDPVIEPRKTIGLVAHDEDGQRMAHEPPAIRGSTFREIARWDVSRGFHGAALRGPFRVPTFEEVLATFPRARLNVDLKARGPGLVRSVLRLVREYGAEDRVRVASFSDVAVTSSPRISARRYVDHGEPRTTERPRFALVGLLSRRRLPNGSASTCSSRWCTIENGIDVAASLHGYPAPSTTSRPSPALATAKVVHRESRISIRF